MVFEGAVVKTALGLTRFAAVVWCKICFAKTHAPAIHQRHKNLSAAAPYYSVHVIWILHFPFSTAILILGLATQGICNIGDIILHLSYILRYIILHLSYTRFFENGFSNTVSKSGCFPSSLPSKRLLFLLGAPNAKKHNARKDSPPPCFVQRWMGVWVVGRGTMNNGKGGGGGGGVGHGPLRLPDCRPPCQPTNHPSS